MTQVAWLIPHLIHGSGGHRTMLQHAYALQQSGYNCCIYIEGSGTQAQAAGIVEKLFGFRFQNVSFGWENIQPADLAIATIWYSAAVVRDLPFPCKRAYLVQDYEAVFNPMGDGYLMAENSYRYGLIPITVGRWLKHVLGTRFGVPAYHLDFGADAAIYRPDPNIRRENAICFIYQPDKPRRCSRIGIDALGIVKHRLPEVTIYLYGSPQGEAGHVWFPHTHLGLLSLTDCNALYSRCAVGLCLSSSNPSRIPFEMMSAGLPVVELWRENTLYDFPQAAVRLADPTPESLATALLGLLADPDRRSNMTRAGTDFMATKPLSLESEQFVRAVDEILHGTVASVERMEPMYNSPAIVADEYTHSVPSRLNRQMGHSVRGRLDSLPLPARTVLRWGARKLRRYLSER